MKVFLDRDVAKYIQRLQKEEKERLLIRLRSLEIDPYLGKKIKGRKNTYSIRVGDFRIIYEIHTGLQEVWVLKVDKRGRVYKRL
ncbi:MAG: type II toxin-antitoxin system RelE/ParE family toxin [Archaeoglobus sp.]|uniref:type II toxin-antitoxin system RelE family toxin n=1 Tax=Archaeoglobus sp. TaxID=1872626 RepID=UPI001E0547BF|nr:type II toxin-antitoxin system RelE/ParE family toxin [Archaeoglobus sp.]MBO8180824.1 type II toxin-antitoxin system RelE/ParE family toxin [Archaeoglobus sp.]